jgi:type IV pilus assembly protein PilE
VAIIGILIAISYPVYNNHVIKMNRAQAHIALLNMAAGMERYHVLHHSYEEATLSSLEMNNYTDNKHYQLEIGKAEENSYQLKATPQNAQRKDKTCGRLTLNEIGQKGISGTGRIEECW